MFETHFQFETEKKVKADTDETGKFSLKCITETKVFELLCTNKAVLENKWTS